MKSLKFPSIHLIEVEEEKHRTMNPNHISSEKYKKKTDNKNTTHLGRFPKHMLNVSMIKAGK